MSDGQTFFSKGFQLHTQLKLLVLELYLQSWARKLLLRLGAGDRAYYVDACAGPGMDDLGNHGSPVRAAREAAILAAQLREPPFHRTVSLNVVAIEKKPARFRELKRNLAPFGANVRAVHGTLTDHFDVLRTEMGEAPALYFIDPFGLEPLRAEVVLAALSRPHSEVFLLFADQAALRHYGVITADAPKESAQYDLLEAFGEIYVAQEAGVRAEKTEDLKPTKERCEAIMAAAFGAWDWKTPIDAAAIPERRTVIVDEYARMLETCAGVKVLRIPLRNASNQHVYHLFHATKSPKGYETMKAAVSTMLTRAAGAGSATETIRLLIRSDIASVESQVRAEFAGRKGIRWADTPGQPSVRRWALQNTSIYQFEMEQLCERLDGLRDRSHGKTIVYDFPAA